MSELKNCPFCDGIAYQSDGLFRVDGGKYHWVQCFNCNASIATEGSQDVANQAWNTRHESGWIKCSDRLPDERKKVLFLEKYNHCSYEIHLGRLNVFKNGKKYWMAQYKLSFKSITHWRELPPPPPEEDKE